MGNALLILGFFYFLPVVVAVLRRHRQQMPILILDLLLGWSVIVWIICLAWSTSTDTRGNVANRARVR